MRHTQPVPSNDQVSLPSSSGVEMRLVVVPQPLGATDRQGVLEQYKTYVASAEHQDNWFQGAQKFFATICMAVLSGFVVLLERQLSVPTAGKLALLVGAACFSFIWLLTAVSYGQALSAKAEIAQEIEELLWIRPLRYEWERKLRDAGYVRVSRAHMFLPLVYLAIFGVLIVLTTTGRL